MHDFGCSIKLHSFKAIYSVIKISLRRSDKNTVILSKYIICSGVVTFPGCVYA